MKPLLQVENLNKFFSLKSHHLFGKPKQLRAVDNVSFDLFPGETLGVVGESGSGKSTLARAILGLIPTNGGVVRYKDKDITQISQSEIRNLVRRELQMIFQDPYASLNPKLKIGTAIAEPMLAAGIARSRKDAMMQVKRLLELVGLREQVSDRYPHEFSGGQRQRIGIARALSVQPKILFCDESVSALDVSVQAQILNLFNQLKQELDLTYVFIGHDLAVVRYISDRVMVMYLGQVVEIGSYAELFSDRTHPYTESLKSAILEPSTEPNQERIILQGDIPSPVNPPSGCRFCTRCFQVMPICREVEPDLVKVSNSHLIRCHLFQNQSETMCQATEEASL